MGSIQVEGGFPLCGEVRIQGSKNATLPILAATVLIQGISIIENCPKIADVFSMVKILENIGCTVHWRGRSIIVNASGVKESRLPKEDVIKMRSSIMLLGSLLGRMGKISIDYPGGCIIGERPVDIHLMALRQLGARIMETDETIYAEAKHLMGAVIELPLSSVGATENSILAAVTADGITKIKNAAKEPEIISLCRFLHNAGAKIKGAGTDEIIIIGTKLRPFVRFHVPSDRIVAGTYLLGCVACCGEIQLNHAPVDHMSEIVQCARQMGCQVECKEHKIIAKMSKHRQPVSFMKTSVYPGFPTDLQSVLMVACSVADGRSTIEETIFENRFKIVKELKAMGADIEILESQVTVNGSGRLQGKSVIAEELRGGAALVVAGLAAQGITVVSNKYFIDRGYEDICKDLRKLGARISIG